MKDRLKNTVVISFVLVCAVAYPAAPANGQSDSDGTAYTEVFYPSAGLRIPAYLYEPEGEGPFPAVIYNHGSRDGRERESAPFRYIGGLLTRAGYAVLVPERRGYGKSDGRIWKQEAGSAGDALVARLQAETDDVLAALDYLRAVPNVDARRVGIMGWSFGGIVTMFAVSRSAAFAAAVDQAGGALTWDRNARLRGELISAAEKTNTPTLLLVAKNDRTTSSITTLAGILDKRGVQHRMVVYDAFTPQRAGSAAPGHAIFSAQGVRIWEKDVLEFLGRYLAPAPGDPPSKMERAR